MKKILIVDDDAMVLRAIAESLKGDEYKIKTASSGMEALEIVEKEKMDLIITDIMMPDLSGLNLISLLREFHSLKLPVIIISSLGANNVIYPSLKIGANDFITKPINFDELLHSVKTLLAK